MKFKKLAIACGVSALLGTPLATLADSDFGIGPPNVSASANLDFEVTIPSFVYFQVGAASAVDTVSMVLDATTELPGSGVAVAQSGAAVNVFLRSNAASVLLDADGTADPLDNAASDNMPWSEILADNSAGTTDIDPPVIDGATSSVNAVAGVINVTDQWEFSFANTAVYPAGLYEGSVIYTATTL